MAYRLHMLFPDREFHVKDEAICRDMKKTTLESVLRALRTDTYEVVLPGEIMERARAPIERMLAVR
jgi:quinolinate synthase